MNQDSKDYPRPSLTADVVVVALASPDARQPLLKVLFIERAQDPFAGRWALPGGFVEPTETVAEGALRELREETGLDRVRVEEVGCFSQPGRDPRGWVVSIAHLAPIAPDRTAEVKAGDDAARVVWLDLHIAPKGVFTLKHEGREVTELAFDHREIVARAVRRLIDRVDVLALDLLPASFAIEQAAVAYHAILGVGVDEEMLSDRLLAERLVTEDVRGRYTKRVSAGA